MKLVDIVALVIVIVVCIGVVVGALVMSHENRESSRLTERAEGMLEERAASDAIVPKQACLELLIDERRYGDRTSSLFRSGMTWIAFLNSVAVFICLVVLARAIRVVFGPKSRDRPQ